MLPEFTNQTTRMFITEFEKDGGRYEGPRIPASSWKEAEAKAGQALSVVGALD